MISELFKKWFDQDRSSITLRPPSADASFLSKCIRCGQCIEACQYRTILFEGSRTDLSLGTPVIDPIRTPCYLSMECVKVCPTGALKPMDKRQVRMAKVSIDTNRCVAYHRVVCKFCFKNCPLQGEAIIIDRIKPIIIEDKCAGCGVCYHVCPVSPKAIRIEPITAD